MRTISEVVNDFKTKTLSPQLIDELLDEILEIDQARKNNLVSEINKVVITSPSSLSLFAQCGVGFVDKDRVAEIIRDN